MNGTFNTQNLYTLFLIFIMIFTVVSLGAVFENWRRIKCFFQRISKLNRGRNVYRRTPVKKQPELTYITLKRHHI